MPERLILRNFQSAGDIVMLTAAVRDLHRCYPDRFVTDVRTSCSDLWLGNPWLRPLGDQEPGVRVIDCHYPIIHRSNSAPYHFLFGFIEYLNDVLSLRIQPTEYRGDVHLTQEERDWFAGVQEQRGPARPFWLFASGGKWDYTIKWWDAARYQAVVDHFRDRIDFVQIGESHHHHPAVEGAIDLRGKTTLRQLVRLMYHAQGAVSAVSLLMHLAAAVEAAPGLPRSRPCVVIAGGREPPHFTAYPHHQFIHTVGALRCCETGGCWKSRTRALGDGDSKDQELCVDVVGDLPRCMDMITAEEVIRRIEMYFSGGALSYLPLE
jgi:ADP-heptose:LPS heptosyltransferase